MTKSITVAGCRCFYRGLDPTTALRPILVPVVQIRDRARSSSFGSPFFFPFSLPVLVPFRCRLHPVWLGLWNVLLCFSCDRKRSESQLELASCRPQWSWNLTLFLLRSQLPLAGHLARVTPRLSLSSRCYQTTLSVQSHSNFVRAFHSPYYCYCFLLELLNFSLKRSSMAVESSSSADLLPELLWQHYHQGQD